MAIILLSYYIHLMPDSSYHAKHLSCEALQTKAIDCERVKIDNGERPLEIKNDEGKVVFFVDNLGPNVHILNSTTSFFELLDTPNQIGASNSILGIKEGKIQFQNEIKLPKIEADALLAKDIETHTIKATAIISDSIINANMMSDEINATTVYTNLLKSETIECEQMKLDDFHTNTLTGKTFVCNEANMEMINSSMLTSHNISTEKLKCKNIVNEMGNIETIINSSFTGNTIESQNIHTCSLNSNMLESKRICGNLVEVKEIHTDKLSIQKSLYGTVEHPLNLAVTQVKSIDVAGENIKIVSKIPCGVISQEIIINGLEVDEDYVVNVALTKKNDCSHTLICDKTHHTLRITYKERVERDSLIKILIHRV